MPAPLTKSLYLDGVRCHRLLWWTANEPGAPELTPSPARQHELRQGTRVGVAARALVPGGIAIGAGPEEDALAATRAAIDAGAKVLYEASFRAAGVLVRADILERIEGGWGLLEVKRSSTEKPEYLADVAVQLLTLRNAGLQVVRAELVLLRPEPHLEGAPLFRREDVTAAAERLLPGTEAEVARQLSMLAGPLPGTPIGKQCKNPDCDFTGRCWAALPQHHVFSLWSYSGRWSLPQAGAVTLLDPLPPEALEHAVRARQVRSVRENRVVVEPGLGAALAAIERPLGYLDFESVSPALPQWPLARPLQHVPVQYSLHREGAGGLEHREHLAAAGADPRRPLAEALLRDAAGCRSLLVWNATFERGCLAELALALPDLKPDLDALAGRLVDLLPVVRENVYVPAFGGSFSIKHVLPALVPGAGYEDLAVKDGLTALAELEQLLLEPEAVPEPERAARREALLRYCERDTWAMVLLHDKLRELAR